MKFLQELRRRRVYRMAGFYVVGAWLVIQVADVLFPAWGLPETTLRFLFIATILCFPIALIFSWIFDITTLGIVRTEPPDPGETFDSSLKRTDYVVLAALVAIGAAIVFGSLQKIVEEVDGVVAVAGVEKIANSIAVLPFANMSGDPSNEPFTLGIHDDLLTHLSRIKSLKTISRTSVLQYKDTTKTIPQIASELGVSSILEGGIQRSGNRVRINMQLIDANTDEHLWAEIYDRELTAENLFAVQGEIATEVAKSLSATLLPEEQLALGKTPTSSMAAYDLYLLGRHHINLRTAASIEQARDYFIRAIEEDSSYVLAYSGLADAYTLLVSYGNMQGSVAIPLAQEAIDQAMQLNETVSEVWASQGGSFLVQQKAPEAVEVLEKAIELDPQNFSAWLWYGRALQITRRFEESITALQTAYGLEPMSQPVNNNLAVRYRQRGDFIRSRQHNERMVQLSDLQPVFYKLQIVETYFWSGNLSRVISEARQILATDPENTLAMRYLIRSYVALGDIQQAKVWVDRASVVDSTYPFSIEVLEAQRDFEELIVYMEDRFDMLGERKHLGYLFILFRTAYLGGQIQTAKSYLAEYLSHLGDRPEVNASDYWNWGLLLMAEFWINHGNEEAGEIVQGQELRDDVLAALSTLNEQGFEHPGTYYGLAMASAMRGKHTSALDALEKALQNGFIDPVRMATEPAFDTLRDDERFIAIATELDVLISNEKERLADTELAPYVRAAIHEPVIVPRSILENYAGYYSDGNFLAHFRLDDNGQFIGQLGQQPDFVILASAQDEFYAKLRISYTIKFVTDGGGAVTHVMTNSSGFEQRYKVVQPPPVAVALENTILERYEGTYATHRVKGTEDVGADGDIWTAVVSVEYDGKVWLNFENQPALEIRPYSETEFVISGFESRLRFEIDANLGMAGQMIYSGDGFEYEFKRQ